MKTDTYTKTVLTVIAICLLILVVNQGNIIPSAHAASGDSKFVSVPLNDDGSINVKIVESNPTEVVIVGWKDNNDPNDDVIDLGAKSFPVRNK